MKAREWLEKATFVTTDLTGGTDGGLLSPEQAKKFLQVAMDYTVILNECRHEVSKSNKFEVPRISFASRIMAAGTEGSAATTVKPTTGLMTLDTVLLKGAVALSDESLESNIEREGFSDTVMTQIAQAVGRDVEELAIKGDTDRDPVGKAEDAYLDLLNGLIAQLQDNLSGSQEINAATFVTYEELFGELVENLPAKYRRNYSGLRLYVPVVHRDNYHRSLSGRGTGLGDQALVTDLNSKLAYRGIPVKEVPIMSGTSAINTAAIDYTTFAFLTDPQNIVVGWHREIKVEKWRHPLEGATYFLPSCRVDIKFADPDACVYAYGIPTTLT